MTRLEIGVVLGTGLSRDTYSTARICVIWRLGFLPRHYLCEIYPEQSTRHHSVISSPLHGR